MKVVLDTNVVVSAILFPRGALAAIARLWTGRQIVPLLSAATTTELIRVLAYPKFRMDDDDIEAVLAAYLPFTETVTALPLRRSRRAVCRDPHDQMFIDLASVGRARVLVTGDADLLALTGDTLFAIERPGEFLKRFPAA